MRGEIIVLREKPDGSKFLGEICGCGKHVRPIPFYLKWSEERTAPVDNEDNVLFLDWTKVSVDKDSNPSLAKQFAAFPAYEDFISPEILQQSDEIPVDKKKLQQLVEIATLSQLNESMNIITMLRTLGVQISAEQAYMVIRTMELVEESSDVDKMLTSFLKGSPFVNSLFGGLADRSHF